MLPEKGKNNQKINCREGFPRINRKLALPAHPPPAGRFPLEDEGQCPRALDLLGYPLWALYRPRAAAAARRCLLSLFLYPGNSLGLLIRECAPKALAVSDPPH